MNITVISIILFISFCIIVIIKKGKKLQEKEEVDEIKTYIEESEKELVEHNYYMRLHIIMSLFADLTNATYEPHQKRLFTDITNRIDELHKIYDKEKHSYYVHKAIEEYMFSHESKPTLLQIKLITNPFSFDLTKYI